MLSIEEITLFTILGFIILENSIEIYLTKRQVSFDEKLCFTAEHNLNF